ncbi:MAG: TlpA family protein disulfide reductase [Proteobacteria bacterium]|nr:TlpA family protein disulfide reductase [Pseudomonadota bacterium]
MMLRKLPAFAAAWMLVAGSCQSASATNADEVEDPAYAAEGEHLGELAAAALVGQPAPAVTVTTIDGEKIDLAKLYGQKPVYLKFWATWCVPCRQQMPGFEKIYETVGQQMQVIAVNIGFNDDEAAVRAYRKKMGLKMPIVMDDGSLGALFNLRVTPQHVLIGRDGRFAYAGHLADARLDAAVQKVLAQPVTQVAVSKLSNPAAGKVYKVGDRVADLAVTTNKGVKIPLGAARGLRGVVFFSTWCESYLATSRPKSSQACKRVREKVDALAASELGKVRWVGVAGGPWSTADDLADYQLTNKIRIPLALDPSGSLFRAFGVRDIPTIALIDPAGRVVRMLGPDETDIAAAVRAAATQTSK